MLDALPAIGQVLLALALIPPVIAIRSYRQFCRDENAAFEIECATFWKDNQ